MKALILVAGPGSRLKSVAGETPKSLIEINGKALLDRQIETMTALGVKRICLATGFRHEVFASRYGERVDFRYNPFYRDCNNIVSFLFARDWMTGDDLLVCYGDLIYDPELLAAAIQSPADIGLVVDRSRVEEGHALVSLKDAAVAAVGPSVPAESADARFVGITKLSAAAVSHLMPATEAALRAGKLRDYYLAGIQILMEQGHRVEPIDVSGLRWSEIDLPADLAAARALWGSHREK
ncbi:phosphocholine cytidylyltransferase family protein [Rhizobium rhizoryzae]|uniref:phosphocholine cytidylyltransferase family protein n=1 Tax=Rhizobium rhizoryzae TaxID=451876 RepID=UPI0028B193CC|nr:phosphocholine cytidylyltransferase family protein [Rhizobium rhizoryzae]